MKETLQPEVAEKYKLVKVPSGTRHNFNGFGVIDLNEVDLSRADALFARGFPHLEVKLKKETTVAADSAKVKQVTGGPATGTVKP